MMMLGRTWTVLFPCVIVCGALAGCMPNAPPIDGNCQVNSALSCDKVLAGNPDAGVELGLVGYSCNGNARPDQNAALIHGVPQGQICAGQGAGTDGNTEYCCTPDTELTTCMYNPVAICPEGDGYQCRGANRPEAFHPGLTCGNGVRDGDLIDFCCHDQPRPIGCSQAKGAASCASGLVGWVCPEGYRPRGEDFGSNESRADYYYFVCGVPKPAPNVTLTMYCCFTPSPVLPGGSCVPSPGIQDRIPSCTNGHFGFACYGRDTPEDDYLLVKCPNPPVQGKSDEGYPASLYCCDYVPPGQGSGTGTGTDDE